MQYPRLSMRLGLALACLLLLMGCVGPHSTGALWAQQNLEQELVIGRQTTDERAAHLHAYELTLADESLTAERGRIEVGLRDCPGAAPKPLELSAGDRVRDTIRLRSGDDPSRQAAVAQVALADWRVRRAQATGQMGFCEEARQALSGSVRGDVSAADSLNGQPNAVDLLDRLGSATVTRDPRHPRVVADPSPTGLSLSNYALGYIDTVRARAPLPQYLAAVYGGVLVDVDSPPKLNIWVPSPSASEWTTEDAVDLLAPAYRQWEPDAIYAALRPA